MLRVERGKRRDGSARLSCSQESKKNWKRQRKAVALVDTVDALHSTNHCFSSLSLSLSLFSLLQRETLFTLTFAQAFKLSSCSIFSALSLSFLLLFLFISLARSSPALAREQLLEQQVLWFTGSVRVYVSEEEKAKKKRKKNTRQAESAVTHAHHKHLAMVK